MADYIRPTPRNPILGLLSDALTGGVEWMRSPQRAQQMQGLGGLLAETGIPATVERMSYGEPLTKGRGMTTRLRPEAEAALMTLAPEAVPIGRAAMAGIRATRGLPVGAATVYHGSPHKFNRFDASKIGTGEGAQAYGHGLYFAESPGVAADYAKTLASPRNRVMENRGVYIEPSPAGDGKWRLAKTSEFGKQIGRTGDATQGITDWRFPNVAAALRYAKKNGLIAKDEKPILTEIAEEGKYRPVRSASEMEDPLYNQLIASEPGYRYTVDLPDPAIARMLDWDKPLSEQANAQAALDAVSKEIALPRMQGAEGAGFAYQHLANATGGPQNAAALLRAQGIPGIRYLDQGSRGAGQGTSNFVVFPGEEDLLRILSVEGGLLAP
jgi:hypothetical protein